MAKRALITGGAGFIGSHVGECFLEHGWSVDVLDDFSTGKQSNVPQSATVHAFDIRSADAARVVREGAFDVMVHLAAQIDVRKSVADPVFDATVNIVGTLNLLEALRSVSARKKCRVVFASTGGAIYGDFVTPPNEETYPKEPESPYGIAKLTVEHYLAFYSRVHGLDYVAVRFGNVYGPRQDPHGEAGVVAIFCNRILEGRALTIFGDGSQTRDYVFAADVADATFRAATIATPAAGRLDVRGVNIGTGFGTSVNDLAQTLLRVAGATTPIEYAPPRPGEQQHSFLNVSKARDFLGWTPSRSLEQGVGETYSWFAARRSRETTRT